MPRVRDVERPVGSERREVRVGEVDGEASPPLAVPAVEPVLAAARRNPAGAVEREPEQGPRRARRLRGRPRPELDPVELPGLAAGVERLRPTVPAGALGVVEVADEDLDRRHATAILVYRASP